jgi:Predicted transcriptional regulator
MRYSASVPKPVKSAHPELYIRLKAIMPAGESEASWLRLAGVNSSFFQDLKKSGRARNDSIDKLVEAAGMTPAQFYAQDSAGSKGGEQPQERVTGTRERHLPFRSPGEIRDIPLLGTALGGPFDVSDEGEPLVVELTDVDLDDVIDYVRRPSSLIGQEDLYCVTIVGDSMKPWARDGTPAYIGPKRQPSIEDHVLVQIMKRDGNGDGRVVSALIKKLCRRTSEYVELEQYNPPLRFRIPVKDIARIHRVIPWEEIIFF